MKNSQSSQSHGTTVSIATAAVLSALLSLVSFGPVAAANATATRSTTIALTSDERRVVVVNREANSVSIIEVKNSKGKDVNNKIAEIPVGEARCVAIHPNDQAAYVTNAISGTVSVVDLNLRGPSSRFLAKEKLTFKAKSSASQSLNSGVGHPPVIEMRPIISDGTAEMAQSSSGVGNFATTGDFP